MTYLKLSIFTFFLFYIESCKEVSLDEQSTTPSISDEVFSTDFNYLPSSTTNQIIEHQFYTLSYSELHEQAEWVAYELKKEYISSRNLKRPYFNQDAKVETKSADWRNYKNSGYDKGHLVPAGDMKFSEDAFTDTFFTSNISPQLASFNNGVWNRLEQKVRYWAEKYDGIYVIAGGVLESELRTIGEEEVAVPNYFYKVLLDTDETTNHVKMIAFLVPHEGSNQPLYEFVVSVDELEQLTGIDFFPNISNQLETELERKSDYKSWSFN
jgi:endonuclease G